MKRLKRLIAKKTILIPGVFNALSALLVERAGFPAVYISGAGLASGVAGLPDIGLLSLEEVARQTAYITSAVSIPALVDIDTGFGAPLSVMRTIRLVERAGADGVQIEDQEFPKRCGHLPGKTLVAPREMERKIAAAVKARKESDFLIVARTDARAVEGLNGAVSRGKRYLGAGADVIFPEALESAKEFEQFAKKVSGRLMANMTEFGKTPYLSVSDFESMGYAIVLFPMTAFRVAARAMEEALKVLRREGTQKRLLDRMQTRDQLYDLIRYAEYERHDHEIAKEYPDE